MVAATYRQWSKTDQIPPFTFYGQGRHQGKMLEGAKEPRGPGGSAPRWGSREDPLEAPWSWCFLSAKIVIEALPEYVFPGLRWQKS